MVRFSSIVLFLNCHLISSSIMRVVSWGGFTDSNQDMTRIHLRSLFDIRNSFFGQHLVELRNVLLGDVPHFLEERLGEGPEVGGLVGGRLVRGAHAPEH